MSGIWRLILCVWCLLIAWPAAAKAFDENQDYTLILPEPDQGRPGDKIEVVEFFMYGCSHCFRFEPGLETWLKTKPADVEFVRVPALFGRHFDLHARAYYALQSLGLAESLHHAWFEEIHVRNNTLETRQAMDKFLQAHGVDLVQFDKAMASFSVQVKLNRAATLLQRYDIRSVPNIVVDSRYKNARGLSHSDMLLLMDDLLARVRQQRQED